MFKALLGRIFGKGENLHHTINELVDGLTQYDHLSGTRWRHRKGGEYCIERIVYRESTMELEVIYGSLTDRVFYSRPLPEFMDGRFTQLPDASPSTE